MSKSSKNKSLASLILLSLMAGLFITLLSGFLERVTTGQYCSPNKPLNATIDCSLQVNNRGIPFAYEIDPNYQPKHGFQVSAFADDVVSWAILAGLVVWLYRRAQDE
jgi:hypothetical protein